MSVGVKQSEVCMRYEDFKMQTGGEYKEVDVGSATSKGFISQICGSYVYQPKMVFLS